MSRTWISPPPSNSHHQDDDIFSRESGILLNLYWHLLLILGAEYIQSRRIDRRKPWVYWYSDILGEDPVKYFYDESAEVILRSLPTRVPGRLVEYQHQSSIMMNMMMMVDDDGC